MADRLAPSPRIHGIVAIIRLRGNPAPDDLYDALVRGGIRHIEITAATPGAHATVAGWARLDAQVSVGMGSIRTPADAEAAFAAGASFLVTPTTVPAVVDAAVARGVPIAVGAMTPSEVDHAWHLGADVVKVFPAADCGGPAYIRAIREPLPEVPVLPTGGVSLREVAAYAAVGAVGLGVAGELVSPKMVTTGAWDEIERRAASLVRAWKEADRG